MNTKSIFASLLISLSFMASCQQFDIAEAPFQEEEKQMSADYNMSSKAMKMQNLPMFVSACTRQLRITA